MQIRLPSLVVKLLSKQWEFMKLTASYLSIAVIEVLMPLITVLFAGTISQAHLDGVGLATTMFNVLVQSMCSGYSSVFDTYGPQVYGSTERGELGTVLMKCLLQGCLMNLVILGPYLNLVYVIGALPASVTGSDADGEGFEGIAIQYLRLIVVNEFLDYTVLMISKYFAIQGHSRFVYMTSLVMILSYILANYVLVSTLHLGVNGLGLSAIIGRLVALTVALIDCFFKIRTKEFIWSGFGFKALLGWKPMVKLGVSGAVSCIAELALYEISTFCSQFDGTTAFSVVIITTQLLNVCWALTEGVARAGATLTGSALGDGNVEDVKLFVILTVINTLLECVPLAITCFLLRSQLVNMFNASEDVVVLFESTFWLACVGIVTYHIQNCFQQGVLVAFGEQKFIAWVSSISCYGIALPIVIITVFFTDMKVIGVMTGWMISDSITALAALYKILTIDIGKEVERTATRVRGTSLKESGENCRQLGIGIDNPVYDVENEELEIRTEVSNDEINSCNENVDIEITSGNLNQEVRNVLTAFLIAAVMCVILAAISLLKQ